MFINISNKIRALAYVLLVIGIFGSLIYGSVYLVTAKGFLKLIGLVVICVGGGLSFTFSFVLSGFAEIIDNTKKIANYCRKESNM